MSDSRRPSPEEVETLLRNAELRDDLEPFLDDMVRRVNVLALPTPVENEYLEAMLAWERAPLMPISMWFEPELKIPAPDSLDDRSLHQLLWEVIHKLYDQRIVLDFSDHLSDRALYTLIWRDILPTREKHIDSSMNHLHWDCADISSDANVWLRYYASTEERRRWMDEHGDVVPSPETPPYRRKLPRRAL